MNSNEINPGIFKVIGVDWGNRGPNSEKAVIVTLVGKDEIEFSVANNWSRDQQQRYDLAKKLIGRYIRYSTWRKEIYAKTWFKELELITDADSSTKVKELSEKNYGKMNPKMKKLLSRSDESEDDSDDFMLF